MTAARSRQEPSSTSQRYVFLDAMRGVAAVSVVVSHVGQRLSPSLDHFISTRLQLGQFGVTLFFLCSGFVIPLTLERRALVGFWISRLFRLFPLYWLTLGALAVLVAAGLWFEPAGFGRRDWLWNVTMTQQWFGRPDALGVFWTLAWEMMFYLSMSVLFVVGAHRWTRTLAVVVLTLANLDAEHHFVVFGWYPLWMTWMAQLFTGTILYRRLRGRIGWPSAGLVLLYYVATMVHVAWRYMWGHEWLPGHGTWSFTPMTTAWVGALAVFIVVFAARRWRIFSAIAWLGTISYSIYLVHLIVIDIGVRPDGPSWLVAGDRHLTMLLWIAGTLLLSCGTYLLVERPFIALGHRVASRLHATRPSRGDDRPAHRSRLWGEPERAT
jgi:peptidoglycan/LPS O-acetylase OafA/YrhL